MPKRLALSVSQLNEYVRRLFQQDPLLREIELKGEISNLKWHQTGTLYFTMKDEQASISCVMYATDALGLQVTPFEGMRVVVSGSVGLYTRAGQYQFYVKEIRAQGVGVLFERYQMLKEQLEREGLFSSEKKRPIPGFVDTVGVVSSPTGAVIHDILSVSLRRDQQTRILLCPVRVQGAEAADEVVSAIQLLDQLEHVSVIILARGGGSMEDLWTFNEERVVRAVAASKRPIVSAIGHETDFTLCDFAADLRAPTPSAAAECVIAVRAERIEQLETLKMELQRAALLAIRESVASLSALRAMLAASRPDRVVKSEMERLARLRSQLSQCVQGELAKAAQDVESRRRELHMLSPYQVLSRGYAIVLADGKPLTSSVHVAEGDPVSIVLYDGRVEAKITKK